MAVKVEIIDFYARYNAHPDPGCLNARLENVGITTERACVTPFKGNVELGCRACHTIVDFPNGSTVPNYELPCPRNYPQAEAA